MPNVEEFEVFIESQGGNAGLAEKMGVAPATVSAWRTGRNNIKLEYKRRMRDKMKYGGRFPDEAERQLTPEDLQALGRDVFRMISQAEGRINQQIQDQGVALGAILQEALKRLGPVP